MIDDDEIAYTSVARGLPAATPFVGPEALQRNHGYQFHLRLGANESPFGPSPHALDAMRAEVERVSWYGDPEVHDLRAAIAARFSASVAQVAVASGIDELLGLLIRVFIEPGDVVVASLGAYPTVAFHVAGFGGVMERVAYRDDRNDLDALAEAAARAHAKLVYLSNPDNPTGSWHTADAIQAFRSKLPPYTVLLLDEAYVELAPQGTATPLDPSDRSVVRLRTFSKAYGMAGARVGYAVTAERTVSMVDRVRLHFGVNRVAQAGALAAFRDDAYLGEVLAQVQQGREDYYALANSLGIAALPSATNFVAFDAGSVERARACVTGLAERGVFIRMPGAPPLNRLIRVTIGKPEQRRAFAAIFREMWPTVADI